MSQWSGLWSRCAWFALFGLYWIVFQQPIGAFVLCLLLFVSVLPMRSEVDNIGQIIFALFAIAGAYVLAVVIGPPPQHPIFQRVALARATFCAWVLLVICVRYFLSNPWGGQKVSMLIGLSGILSCGGDRIGWKYHAFSACFACFALLAVASDDPTRPTFSKVTFARKRLAALGLVLASGIACFFFLSLPPLYERVIEALHLSFLNHRQVGFDTYFRLGSLSSVYQSNRVVMRVHGRVPGQLRLRGAVYDRYAHKTWKMPHNNPTRLLRTQKIGQEKRPTSVWIDYVQGDAKRYFAPLFGQHWANEEGSLLVDSMGVLLPRVGEHPERLKMNISPLLQPKIAKPSKYDLEVPLLLLPTLSKLAKQWTNPKMSQEAKVFALSQILQRRYKYSLSFQRGKKPPVLDFLLVNKQGHCEYFASAFALLARTLGIPTRVIGGYLVTEYNTWGNYYIVREQHAHAWVEAWLPNKGWQTVDPTPSSGPRSHMRDRSRGLSALLDWFGVSAERFRRWLLTLSITQILSIVAFFFFLWFLLRLFRYWRERKQRQMLQASGYREPLPSFPLFLQSLQQQLAKKESEPIELYAERLLKHLPHSERLQEAVQLLLDYASLRYGQIGREDELETRLSGWLLRTEKKEVS